jgi:hypothetical protein
MPFYTQILSQRSPTSIYKVDGENIVLIPAGPFRKEDGKGNSTLYDAINFYTNDLTKSDHIKRLRRFVIIYSFLFKDAPMFMFDEGELTNHIEVDKITSVPTNDTNGQQKVDYEDILSSIYFLNKPNGKVGFKALYHATKDEYLDAFLHS